MANEETLRDYLKWVTADLAQTRQRLQEVESAEHEPIAIVGMACRFPGGVGLARGAVGPGREGRGRGRRRSPPTAAGTWRTSTTRTRSTAGTSYVARAASCTTRPASTPRSSASRPREALAMDPQQRLLLETVVGGVRAGRHRPGDAARQPHRRLRRGHRTTTTPPACTPCRRASRATCGTGSAASVASGRVAYALGLEGPARDHRHRLLLLAGGPAPGRPGAAPRRVHAGPGRRRHRDGHPGRASSSSPASAGWPPTGAARRSPTAPTAPAGPRASACCCWSGCPTPGATATRCWRWSAAPRSTRTAPATA